MTVIERAAEHIGARRMADGRWSYYDDAMQREYIVYSGDLGKLVGFLDHKDPAVRRDAYTHWCAATSALEVD